MRKKSTSFLLKNVKKAFERNNFYFLEKLIQTEIHIIISKKNKQNKVNAACKKHNVAPNNKYPFD